MQETIGPERAQITPTPGGLSRRDFGRGALLTLFALTTDSACSSPAEPTRSPEAVTAPFWPIRSVDTMKQSRDEALVILQALQKNPDSADQMRQKINQEVQNIAALNATHVAIGTPYDEKFFPVLQAYVNAARNHKLNIWLRGNFSAYDLQDANNPSLGGWFNTPHNPNFMEQPQKIAQFIDQHGDLFKKGDIFMPWSEPENVVDFYKRTTDYENLLLAEYDSCQPLRARGVLAGNCSMNGDVAKALDPGLVKALGNVVMVDHYVSDPEEMGQEITALHQRYAGAHVILGEFGANSPPETAQQQATFANALFDQFKKTHITGMNWWVDIGGNTALENTLTDFRPAYYVVQQNYGASSKAKTR